MAALVTGASARLGYSMAEHLAKRGYDIALHYGRSQDKAQKAAEDIKNLGVECVPIQADLSKPEQVATLMSKALKQFPHISLLINSASVFEAACVADTSDELLRRQMAVNFEAPFILTRHFTNSVKGGVIVNMLDERISRNDPSHAAYTLSKKALKDLTMISARELAPSIRVCAIAPGYILPPSSGAVDEDKVLKQIPLARKGGTKDILLALDYILEADYVTGQVLYVDGGRHV